MKNKLGITTGRQANADQTITRIDENAKKMKPAASVAFTANTNLGNGTAGT